MSLAPSAGVPRQGGLVRERLVRAAGDPGLAVAYRLAEPERWVDADGIEIPTPHAAPGRAVTPLLRGGDIIAAVTHDPSVLAPVDLEAALGPATRLAIENERLRAGILAELSALRVSRGRIVAAGDRERSRLERDLHDGAQQRLLALFYDLRMARVAAVADGLEPETLQLDVLIASARAAHEELRELAHGIFPADPRRKLVSGRLLRPLLGEPTSPWLSSSIPPAPIKRPRTRPMPWSLRRSGTRRRRAPSEVRVVDPAGHRRAGADSD